MNNIAVVFRPGSSNRRKGFTVIELLLCSALMGVLLLVTALTLQIGLSGLNKTNAQADLVQRLQVAGSLWVRDVLSSTPEGVTVEPGACGVLLPRLDSTPPRLQGVNGNLEWRGFRLYHLQAAERKLYVRQLELVTPTDVPLPLFRADVGEGIHPLAHYREGKKLLGEGFVRFDVAAGQRMFTLRLEGRQKRYGREEEESVVLHCTAVTRN